MNNVSAAGVIERAERILNERAAKPNVETQARRR
jgi:hypothetical protein